MKKNEKVQLNSFPSMISLEENYVKTIKGKGYHIPFNYYLNLQSLFLQYAKKNKEARKFLPNILGYLSLTKLGKAYINYRIASAISSRKHMYYALKRCFWEELHNEENDFGCFVNFGAGFDSLMYCASKGWMSSVLTPRRPSSEKMFIDVDLEPSQHMFFGFIESLRDGCLTNHFDRHSNYSYRALDLRGEIGLEGKMFSFLLDEYRGKQKCMIFANNVYSYLEKPYLFYNLNCLNNVCEVGSEFIFTLGFRAGEVADEAVAKSTYSGIESLQKFNSDSQYPGDYINSDGVDVAIENFLNDLLSQAGDWEVEEILLPTQIFARVGMNPDMVYPNEDIHLIKLVKVK